MAFAFFFVDDCFLEAKVNNILSFIFHVYIMDLVDNQPGGKCVIHRL